MSFATAFLTAQDLGYELPDGTVLFKNLNLSLNTKKIALVGPNGIGKSTLAKILCGELQATSGKINKNTEVKYFAQTATITDQAVHEYLQEVWEQSGYDSSMAEFLLQGISLDLALGALSGGEQMRVRLLKTISESASLLILDEPSNNLDMSSKEVLIQFINQYANGLLLISHDRLLLQQVDQILELSNQGLSVYGGNFQDYEQQRQKQQLKQEAELAYLKKEKRKLQLEGYEKIKVQEKRMRSGAQSAEKGGMPKILLGARKRQAQKSLGNIESKEQKRLEQSHHELLQKILERKIDDDLLLQLPEVILPTGSEVCRAVNLNLRFKKAANDLWKTPISFQIDGGDRVAIQGRNGVGKTSLLKFLTSQSGADDWLVPMGEFKKIQRPFFYLDQSLIFLNKNSEEKLIEFVMQDSRFDITQTRNLLARYQFYGQEVFKKIKDLSGGEKLKLGLSHLFLTRLNYEVLILDEPTNNLDLKSLEVLEKVLNSFKGALIVISHDPVFLKKMAINKVILLE